MAQQLNKIIPAYKLNGAAWNLDLLNVGDEGLTVFVHDIKNNNIVLFETVSFVKPLMLQLAVIPEEVVTPFTKDAKDVRLRVMPSMITGRKELYFAFTVTSKGKCLNIASSYELLKSVVFPSLLEDKIRFYK